MDITLVFLLSRIVLVYIMGIKVCISIYLFVLLQSKEQQHHAIAKYLGLLCILIFYNVILTFIINSSIVLRVYMYKSLYSKIKGNIGIKLNFKKLQNKPIQGTTNFLT